MATQRLFDDFERTNTSKASYTESHFAFLNRCATPYFTYVRQFMEEWISHVPVDGRADLIGRLRKDKSQHEAAFWELYLHEGFRRSGYEIEIHPETGGTAHPDFLMTTDEARFYLEAVTVGREPAAIAEDARLKQVYEVLSSFQIRNFTLSCFDYGIGPNPLATRPLRAAISTWLAGLDPDAVSAGISPPDAFSDLPTLMWEHDGWSLEINAMPIKESVRDQPHAALGVMGSGEATMVDNRTGLRRVLAAKSSKYGALDAPLVVAVQSNTEYPTHDYDIEAVLFGETARRPTDPNLSDGQFRTEGFWMSERGWQRDHCPTIVSACGLKIWSLTKVPPCVWHSFSPTAQPVQMPPWIAAADVSGPHAECGPANVDAATHFALDAAVLNGPSGLTD